MTHLQANTFTAIVLAGDRTSSDPVAQAAGSPCKALARVGGRPMILRVLDTLGESGSIGDIVVCGPAEAIVRGDETLARRLSTGRTRWLPPRETPSTSALAALGAVAEGLPVMLTTADHALLKAEVVDHFCAAAADTRCDVAAGLTRYDQVMARFPGMRRTRTRFSDGAVCGCNLFAFLTPAGRTAADLWRQVEHERKHPVKMLNRLGWGVVLQYLVGRLRLEDATRHISRRMGVRAGVVMLPFPEAAVDVDTPQDWRFADRVASMSGGAL